MGELEERKDGNRVIVGITVGVVGTRDGTRVSVGVMVVGTSEGGKEGESLAPSGIFVHIAKNLPQKAESEEEHE
jgi:hypothetical protein